MTAPSFTYSGNVYTGAAAGTVDFALTSTTGSAIAYLQPSHIHVYKSSNQGTAWTELTRPGQWDFVTSGTVARLVTGITAGDWVKVQRITPSTSAYVTFQSSSLLTADQLNDDTLFNTYLNQERYDQGDQSSVVAAAATTAAATATTASTTATATANAASAAATSATTTANAASASAATALSQSNTAITDSAAALTASANAVSTANTASTNAANAVTTAGTASTNATAAVNTANTAASNASTALSQSTTALSNSSTALSTANTAASNASTALTNSSNAVTTANTASTNASNAVTTANTANTNATAALNAVASSLQYVLVANVAAIPSSPSNNYAVEVADSTGIESFSPLANRPAGFVGDTGLSVRMQYSTTGPTWNWLNYFPNNAETRYLKLSGGTLTGQLRADDSTSVAAPVIAFDGDTNTGLAHTGADELALVTGGTARLTVDPAGVVAVTNSLSVGGQAAVVTNDARLTDTRTPTDGSVTNAKVSASAAIAGTKISPDFGAQNRTSTGTSTAASFIPTSSTAPTNGVYLPAANSVAISTNSAERIRIGANGEIGLSGANYGTNGQVLTSAGSGAAPTWQTLSVSANSISQGNTSATVTDTGSDGRFVVTTEGSERLRVDSSGRLGIGTTSPVYPLVVSAAGASGIEFGPAFSGTANLVQHYSRSGNVYVDAANAAAQHIFNIGATERARIDSSGRLLVGTSSALGDFAFQASNSSNIDLVVSNAASFTAGTSQQSRVVLGKGFSGAFVPMGAISARPEDPTSGDHGILTLSTNRNQALSERMRITSIGDVYINKTSSARSIVGAQFESTASYTILGLTSTSQRCIDINRLTTDGNLIEFYQDTTLEGTVSVSGTTVSYNGAHLSRWSQLPSGVERTEILRGSVLSNIDEMCEWGDEKNEQLNRMKVSDVEGDKNVSGVFQAWDDDDDTYTNDFYCAMTGDFIIRIAAGITVERGDLLMSAGDGTAKPQDDDIIRSETIAKVTSTNVSCTYEDGSYCVPCVLMAC